MRGAGDVVRVSRGRVSDAGGSEPPWGWRARAQVGAGPAQARRPARLPRRRYPQTAAPPRLPGRTVLARARPGARPRRAAPGTARPTSCVGQSSCFSRALELDNVAADLLEGLDRKS